MSVFGEDNLSQHGTLQKLDHAPLAQRLQTPSRATVLVSQPRSQPTPSPLPAHHYLLRVLGWLPWCLGPTSGAAARSKAKLMQCCCGRHRSTSGDVTGLLLIATLVASIHANRLWQRRPELHLP